MTPFFSILVVCLNAGSKLEQTITSIQAQDFTDYEIIVKDGGSTDGSLDFLKGQLRILQQKDSGIYDAMNQAAEAARGRYVYFLNCGDFFAERDVLSKIHSLILEKPAKHGIYYGNIFERLTGQCVPSNPSMDAFGCYRMYPAIRHAFIRGSCSLNIPLTQGLLCGRIMNSFLPASLQDTGEKR